MKRLHRASRRREEPKRGVAFLDSLTIPKEKFRSALQRIEKRSRWKLKIKYHKGVKKDEDNKYR